MSPVFVCGSSRDQGHAAELLQFFERQAVESLDHLEPLRCHVDHLTKGGDSKIVPQCSYPLTGIGCVKRIYSDLATFECTPQGLKLIDKVEGLGHAELETLIGLPIAA